MISVNAGQGLGAETGIVRRQDISLAVNAYIAADRSAREGNENAAKERGDHLRLLQRRYWRMFDAILAANIAKRHSHLDFPDDERLFLDLGLVDMRLADGAAPGALAGEVRSKELSGCFYPSEWLAERYHQLQLETDLSAMDDSDEDKYASQLGEARRRVLSRLSEFLTGLPGVPLELSEAFRSGDMDRVVIAAGINCLGRPTRKNFLRRRQLWTLREQVLTKARARASNQGALKLFELLNEVYASDWRARYENRQQEDLEAVARPVAAAKDATASVSVSDPKMDAMMSEARQMRMRMTVMAAVDGHAEPDPVLLTGGTPRLTKAVLARIIPLAQAFDRTLTEMPPIIIVPGSGRGFFAWEAGCLLLALRPMVGADDSLATALAWQRMLDDSLKNGDVLRSAYAGAFPGAVFDVDFPVDYRAWLCRLTKGDVSAMQPEKRTFFRDFIGPDLSGPMLPPNLRNVGPQTMVAICRRLEKQVAAAAGDVVLHRRLAAIYWQQGEYEAAGLQFTAAMQMAPDDGETLFAAGMFMRSRDEGEAANECFKFGAERAADGMWGVYCRDALANLL